MREGQVGWTDQAISEALDVSRATIARVRQAFVEQGLEAALNPQSAPEYRRRKLDGSAEAHLIALACSQPPQGRSSWSLRLLADEMVTLDYVESISHESVRQVLNKNELKPWLNESWCIPPKANAAFVCCMEDVLDVYTLPYDPLYPTVCMDETSKQLVGETRQPLPVEPGQPQRYDVRL